jgi:pyruvate ferredoxin oxidoreductase alpha subunit
VCSSDLLPDEAVKNFIGEYSAQNSLLDTEKPVTFGPVALQNSYFEFRIDQEKAMEEVLEAYKNITEEYAKISGRKYDFFEKYQTEDAQKLMILMGSAAGTAKMAVDSLRKKGEKVGLVKINLFRPFPFSEIRDVINCVPAAQEIIVLDRAQSIGSKAPLYSEVVNSLYNLQPKTFNLKSYIYGLGGRDIFQKQIEEVLEGKIKEKYIQ